MQGRSRFLLDMFTTGALVVASAVVVWAVLSARTEKGPSPPKRDARLPVLPTAPITMDGAVLGVKTASAGLLMFSDFECPFCGNFATTTLPELIRRYVDTGQLVVAFRQMPLTRIHKNAEYAAEIATCALEEGRFWQVHDQLFQKPNPKSPADFKKRATAAGINAGALDACLSAGRGKARVEADLKLAVDLKVESTPWFFVGKVNNGQLTAQSVIRGAVPIAEFDTAIRKVK